MKTTLSFWKRAYNYLKDAEAGLRREWKRGKSYFLPNEKNLLISCWYDRDWYRRNRVEYTVYDFLDNRVRYMEDYIGYLGSRQGVKELYAYLLRALQHEEIREKVVAFLESPSPEENFLPVIKAIRSAWRMKGVESGAVKRGSIAVTIGGGQPMVEAGAEEGKSVEARTGDGKSVEVMTKEGDGAESGTKESERVEARNEERGLNARTYVIAAELAFELEDKQAEFEVLSRNVPDLKKFVQKRFGVEKLAGRFEEFKGYSYKLTLKEKSSAKRGQLKTPLRQIRDHPEIFGEAVAMRAGKILRDSFD